MVSVSANIRMSPLGILLALITLTSTIFYFRDMIKQSRPLKKLSDFANRLKAQGYNVVGLQAPDISLKDLLIASIEVAKRGGSKVQEVRLSNKLKESSKGKTDEGMNDVLTQGDILSHRAMYYSFKNTWQYLTIISEEKDMTTPKDLHPLEQLSSDEVDSFLTDKMDMKVPKSDVVVWIDPLDATKEYSEDLREYVTTMVCIAVNGKAVIGVIHKPFEGKTFWAWRDHGHNVPKKPNGAKRNAPWITVSRSHAGDVNQTARKAFGEEIKVIPAGGAGYKVISVVAGEVDIYLHTTKIKKWDVCAGNAILDTLEGKMTSLKGEDIAYDKDSSIVLKHGLFATLKDHDVYLKELRQLVT